MFYITFSGYYLSRHREKIPERKSHNYEIELCTTPNFQSVVDGELYNRAVGNIFFTKPGATRQTIGEFECYCLHFQCHNEDFCRKYLDQLPTQIFNIDTYKYTQCLKEFVFIHHRQLNEPSEENKLLRDAKLTTLILELYDVSRTQISSGESSKYANNIAVACQYINDHFKEPIGIDEIAKAAMLSPSFTYVIFKKVTGMTPHDFLTNARIHYACEQLIYTSDSVAEISLDCGFSNTNYLNYAFSKQIGMTPGQYRRNYRRKLE